MKESEEKLEQHLDSEQVRLEEPYKLNKEEEIKTETPLNQEVNFIEKGTELIKDEETIKNVEKPKKLLNKCINYIKWENAEEDKEFKGDMTLETLYKMFHSKNSENIKYCDYCVNNCLKKYQYIKSKNDEKVQKCQCACLKCFFKILRKWGYKEFLSKQGISENFNWKDYFYILFLKEDLLENYQEEGCICKNKLHANIDIISLVKRQQEVFRKIGIKDKVFDDFENLFTKFKNNAFNKDWQNSKNFSEAVTNLQNSNLLNKEQFEKLKEEWNLLPAQTLENFFYNLQADKFQEYFLNKEQNSKNDNNTDLINLLKNKKDNIDFSDDYFLYDFIPFVINDEMYDYSNKNKVLNLLSLYSYNLNNKDDNKLSKAETQKNNINKFVDDNNFWIPQYKKFYQKLTQQRWKEKRRESDELYKDEKEEERERFEEERRLAEEKRKKEEERRKKEEEERKRKEEEERKRQEEEERKRQKEEERKRKEEEEERKRMEEEEKKRLEEEEKKRKEEEENKKQEEIKNNAEQEEKKEGEEEKKEGEEPKPEGEESKKEGEVPKSEGEVPKTEGEVPKTEGEVPKSEGEVPKTEGEIPKIEVEESKKEEEEVKKEGEEPKKEGEEPKKESEEIKNEIKEEKKEEEIKKEVEEQKFEGEEPKIEEKKEEVEAPKKEEEIPKKEEEKKEELEEKNLIDGKELESQENEEVKKEEDENKEIIPNEEEKKEVEQLIEQKNQEELIIPEIIEEDEYKGLNEEEKLIKDFKKYEEECNKYLERELKDIKNKVKLEGDNLIETNTIPSVIEINKTSIYNNRKDTIINNYFFKKFKYENDMETKKLYSIIDELIDSSILEGYRDIINEENSDEFIFNENSIFQKLLVLISIPYKGRDYILHSGLIKKLITIIINKINENQTLTEKIIEYVQLFDLYDKENKKNIYKIVSEIKKDIEDKKLIDILFYNDINLCISPLDIIKYAKPFNEVKNQINYFDINNNIKPIVAEMDESNTYYDILKNLIENKIPYEFIVFIKNLMILENSYYIDKDFNDFINIIITQYVNNNQIAESENINLVDENIENIGKKYYKITAKILKDLMTEKIPFLIKKLIAKFLLWTCLCLKYKNEDIALKSDENIIENKNVDELTYLLNIKNAKLFSTKLNEFLLPNENIRKEKNEYKIKEKIHKNYFKFLKEYLSQNKNNAYSFIFASSFKYNNITENDIEDYNNYINDKNKINEDVYKNFKKFNDDMSTQTQNNKNNNNEELILLEKGRKSETLKNLLKNIFKRILDTKTPFYIFDICQIKLLIKIFISKSIYLEDLESILNEIINENIYENKDDIIKIFIGRIIYNINYYIEYEINIKKNFENIKKEILISEYISLLIMLLSSLFEHFNNFFSDCIFKVKYNYNLKFNNNDDLINNLIDKNKENNNSETPFEILLFAYNTIYKNINKEKIFKENNIDSLLIVFHSLNNCLFKIIQNADFEELKEINLKSENVIKIMYDDFNDFCQKNKNNINNYDEIMNGKILLNDFMKLYYEFKKQNEINHINIETNDKIFDISEAVLDMTKNDLNNALKKELEKKLKESENLKNLKNNTDTTTSKPVKKEEVIEVIEKDNEKENLLKNKKEEEKQNKKIEYNDLIKEIKNEKILEELNNITNLNLAKIIFENDNKIGKNYYDYKIKLLKNDDNKNNEIINEEDFLKYINNVDNNIEISYIKNKDKINLKSQKFILKENIENNLIDDKTVKSSDTKDPLISLKIEIREILDENYSRLNQQIQELKNENNSLKNELSEKINLMNGIVPYQPIIYNANLPINEINLSKDIKNDFLLYADSKKTRNQKLKCLYDYLYLFLFEKIYLSNSKINCNDIENHFDFILLEKINLIFVALENLCYIIKFYNTFQYVGDKIVSRHFYDGNAWTIIFYIIFILHLAMIVFTFLEYKKVFGFIYYKYLAKEEWKYLNENKNKNLEEQSDYFKNIKKDISEKECCTQIFNNVPKNKSTLLLIQSLLFDNNILPFTITFLCLLLQFGHIVFLAIPILLSYRFFPILIDILRGIWGKANYIGPLYLITLLTLYVFSVWAFQMMPDTYIVNNYDYSDKVETICNSPLQCALYFINEGLSTLGNLGAGPHSFQNKTGLYFKAFFFELIFFFIINLILTNVFIGIVVDTINELRTKTLNNSKKVCFICQITEEGLSNQGNLEDFNSHIKHKHNIWKYVNTMTNLMLKDELEFSHLEKYIWELMKSKDIDWIPNCINK